MAAPFVFVPQADTSTQYGAPYHNYYYGTPQGGPSPFLPPNSLPYSSPYLAPSDGPRTPNAFDPNSVLWPEETPQYESPYTASWTPLAPRQRTNSWHGPAAARPGSPFLQPTAPAFLHAHSNFNKAHKKSVSWDTTPAWAKNAHPYLNAGVPAQIHPWLNAEAPSPVFHFDLAHAAFLPLQLVSTNPPQSAVVGTTQIREHAFYPPSTRLRILHPRLPFWPIDIALPSTAHGAPPISLGDVLITLHRAMHQRITHADWATLGKEDEQRVTHAFTARCRAEAVRSGVPPAQLRDREVAVRNQGVKRVDFLLGKTVFLGLSRAREDPEGCLRLVTM
ncbi:hypothetical protein C8F04DRAFT_1191210 [Mycena alexandri]|uniref:DUF6699 domain-containing protein n=1 Tax=Mycena alexandri TaxID=1745969 RepID=A0AAD6SF66_9AGAR|nr:hypothetical protein C8F04DRAFT_1191210 [Mycena alexandri]